MPRWSGLELVHRLDTFPCTWQRLVGDQFPAFADLCLQPSQPLPHSYPCPNDCGCWHKILLRHDQASAIGACQCHPPTCPDLELSLEQITCLKLNFPKLGRAICRALLLDSKPAQLGLRFTLQLGSWSAAAVPAILTVQSDPAAFQLVIAELVAQLNQPFILLSPTSRHLRAHSQSLLARVHAGFFPLETTVTVTPSGILLPTKAPGELFAALTPQPNDLDQDVTTRAFALIEQLDSELPLPPPTTLAVFRLYCIEALSAAETARRCHCSKTTIISRLALIRHKTGIDPARFRTLSPHLAKLENQLSDPRARHIHRPSAIDDADTDDPGQTF